MLKHCLLSFVLPGARQSGLSLQLVGDLFECKVILAHAMLTARQSSELCWLYRIRRAPHCAQAVVP
jgi:hypothetical protein